MAGIKRFRNNILLVFILTISSICLYSIQIRIFQKPQDTAFYFRQDLAFVPVQAIIVTLVLNKLLSIIEKRYTAKKINVIISAFFSELGTSILLELARLNENQDDLSQMLKINQLNKENINAIKKMVNQFSYSINATPQRLEFWVVFYPIKNLL